MLHTDTGQRKKYVTSAEFMLMLSFACRDGFHCPFIPTKEKKNKTKSTINHNVPAINSRTDWQKRGGSGGEAQRDP